MKRLTVLLLTIAGLACACSQSSNWSKEEKEIINSPDSVLHVYTMDVPCEEIVLRTECRDFTSGMLRSKEYRTLAGKLVSTVTSPEQDGVGIAGPQVGISRRIVAVLRYDKPGTPFEVYPNIRISAFRGEKQSGPEGCLSVPGKRGDVLRYRDIDICYTNPSTLRDTLERIEGFTAVIFQHECDHLDGIIYTDKII